MTDKPESNASTTSAEVPPDLPDAPGDLPAAGADEEVVDELTTARRQADEWKDKCLRALAEQQNIQRRSANELQDAVRFANAGLLRSLLEVVDDFERFTEAAAQADSADDEWMTGIRLVQDKLQRVLTEQGVERIDAVGQPFDPARHEALMQQPSADHDPGTVIQQVQPGYVYRDRILRPAKVIVAAAPAAAGDDAN